MALDFDLPQEDELALNVLSGCISPCDNPLYRFVLHPRSLAGVSSDLTVVWRGRMCAGTCPSCS
jgi:hypothetical protein